MRVEILSIGNELLSGAIVDTNSAWMAERLYALGARVEAMHTVADELEAVAEVLRRTAARCDLILCTGGLGPTEDDLTAEAAALAAGVALERNAEAAAQVTEVVSGYGLAVTERQLGQADLPAGSAVLRNHHGTAPAFALTIGACEALFFPGPPRELQPLFEREVPPRLPAGSARSALQLRTFGRSESRLADLVRAIELPAGVELGYQVAFPEILLRLLSPIGAEREEGARQVEEAAARLEAALGELVYARGELDFPTFFGEALATRGLKLALAESCTGGYAAKLLTDAPGASRFLTFSAVTYANEAKVGVLGVSPATLEAKGAVSEEVALEMARGARRVGGADLALAITGIAGPEGGTEEKPVGTVCFAVSGPGEHELCLTRTFRGSRERIRRGGAFTAFELGRQAIGAGAGRRL
ncbi:MAG: CinA family nicotinamide mononucleotide deamidase-related protein [Deltaproteobacteria bacterium]|nr:CinA family nicotinamide mononucleotide deamidase-related protein [Deltaproteobacteria bacterium]